MGDITGFLKVRRKEAGNRPVPERICDFSEIEQVLNSEDRMLQASRCMDCGIPFCHWSCPVDNLVPEWNDMLFRGDWKGAYNRLAATNNFPEFTGRICPAPCEHACVLSIYDEPVTIRENEVAIVEKAFSEGYVRPYTVTRRSGKKVAVIGSGPAGMAAADLLNKAGHEVTLFEKEPKAGGLLRYGVPDFKLSKAVIDRRFDIMLREGVAIKTSVNIGKDLPVNSLINGFDAVCIAIGASQPRDLSVEGRDLQDIHFALDFLISQNRFNENGSTDGDNYITAREKNVLVIGGGDTGSDCVGTAIRQKCTSVTQIEIMPEPPHFRETDNPWPWYSKVMKTSTSHEEGCLRMWSLSTVRFIGHDGHVTGAEVEEVIMTMTPEGLVPVPVYPTVRRVIEADMVLLALGFTNPVYEGLISDLGVEINTRKMIRINKDHTTSIPKVFAAGDAVNGASLVVNAIASGRGAAKGIDQFLRLLP
jgi:glutamate synthase (NADPH/NADH) small chain